MSCVGALLFAEDPRHFDSEPGLAGTTSVGLQTERADERSILLDDAQFAHSDIFFSVEEFMLLRV